MTQQQRLYLRELRDSFGLGERDCKDLLRAYGLPYERPWGDAEVERAAEVLLEQGPIYQDTTRAFERASAEWRSLESRREKGSERRKAA